MADNVSITAGAGTTIRTLDNGAGIQKQVFALDLGGESAESLITGVVPVGGKTVTPNNTLLTRPANTTAYAIGQVFSDSTTVGTYMTFPNCARVSGGSGVLIGINLLDEVNAVTPMSPILWLFNGAPSSALNDGAALGLSNADLVLCIGAIPLISSFLGNASASPSGARLYSAPGLNVGFKAIATSLFGVVQMAAAYTPVSAEKVVVQLQILQD